MTDTAPPEHHAGDPAASGEPAAQHAGSDRTAKVTLWAAIVGCVVTLVFVPVLTGPITIALAATAKHKGARGATAVLAAAVAVTLVGIVVYAFVYPMSSSGGR